MKICKNNYITNKFSFRTIRHRDCFGQSMVEALVAVGITMMLITGLVIAATSALRSGHMSKDRTQALQYAKEGMEIVRIIKESNWNAIPQHTTMYCLPKGSTLLGEEATDGCPVNIDSLFTRSILFSDDPPDCVGGSCRKVTLTVSWMENSQTRSVELTSYLTNWRVHP